MYIEQSDVIIHIPTAATLRYVRETEKIHLAMQPLELIKRVSMDVIIGLQ